MHVCMLSRLIVSYSLQPCGQRYTRFLCPWDSSGKNTEVGCHSLLQGIFLTQGGNPSLLSCIGRWIFLFLPLASPGKPSERALNQARKANCNFMTKSRKQQCFSETGPGLPLNTLPQTMGINCKGHLVEGEG